MTLEQKFKNKKFIVTSEIGPPKGTDISPVIKSADLVKKKVDGINVTDLQSSVMRLGSLAVCHILLDMGIEPIYQLTCRDRSRLALQSDLLSAHVLGIRNVLILTGDHPSLGDHPDSKPVYDLDAVTLLETAGKLNSGYDMAGNKLNSPTDIFVGAVVNPGAEPLEPEIIKMNKKIAAGAKFLQTQVIYDVKVFQDFLKACGNISVPILTGIVPLKSSGMANYMNAHVPGVHVPDALISEIEAAFDKRKKSIEIAARIIRELKGICAGIHIMPIGWDDLVPGILEKSGL